MGIFSKMFVTELAITFIFLINIVLCFRKPKLEHIVLSYSL